MRATFIANAPTWLDETRDPDALQIELKDLARFDKPALLTSGTDSAPFFGPVVDMVAQALPRAQRITITAPTTYHTSASPHATSN